MFSHTLTNPSASASFVLASSDVLLLTYLSQALQPCFGDQASHECLFHASEWREFSFIIARKAITIPLSDRLHRLNLEQYRRDLQGIIGHQIAYFQFLGGTLHQAQLVSSEKQEMLLPLSSTNIY